MIIYYFIHTVGRDNGNSGIPRVSRNLGHALKAMPTVTIVPVRWDEVTSSVVHVEQSFHDAMRLHGGPDFGPATRSGTPIHTEMNFGNAPAWLLVPEAPHLGGRCGDIGPTHLSLVAGYARLHGLRTAAIFHDAMPITHLGQQYATTPEALGFTIYTMALASFDVVLPVSQASGQALTGLFGRYGVEWQPQRCVFEPILLPEEVKGHSRLAFIEGPGNRAARRHEFCMWGTIFPHKNQLAVMEAFNQLCQMRPDLDLVLHHVGLVDAPCVELVRRFVRRSQGRIKLHGFASDAAMMALIRRSRATLFVSRVEGYGLPLAESLWLGRPCVTSRIAPMTEIAAGGGAVLVDPTSLTEIARAMERLATDNAFFTSLLDELRRRPLRTWDDYGAAVFGILANVESEATTSKQSPPAYYTPEQHSRPRLKMESFLFSAHDMQLGEQLMRDGLVRKADGRLQYDKVNATGSVDRARVTSEAQTICFGPYYTVGPGEYHLRIDGVLSGHCRLRITADEGRSTLLDTVLDTLTGTHVVITPGRTEKMEFVLMETPTLRTLKVDNFSLTRWHAI